MAPLQSSPIGSDGVYTVKRYVFLAVSYWNMCAIFDYELLHRQSLQFTVQRWQEFSVRLQDLYGAAIAIITSRLMDQRRTQLGVIYEEHTSSAAIFSQSLAVQLQRMQEPFGGLPTPRSSGTRDCRKPKRRDTKKRNMRVY